MEGTKRVSGGSGKVISKTIVGIYFSKINEIVHQISLKGGFAFRMNGRITPITSYIKIVAVFLQAE